MNNDSNNNGYVEDTATVSSSLVQFRKEIGKNSNFDDFNKDKFSDAFLLKFLRSKDFDLEKSTKQLKQYVYAKRKIPELFLYPSELKMVFDDNIVSILKDRTEKGEAISIIRLANWNDDNYDWDCILSAYFVSVEVALFDEETQRNGIIQIMDLKDVDFEQLVCIEGYQLKRFAKIFQKVLPCKMNSCYIINTEKKAQLVEKKLKERMSEEDFEKFHIYGTDLTEFHKDIPPRILPVEMGGESGQFSSSEWYNHLLEKEKDIIDMWSHLLD